MTQVSIRSKGELEKALRSFRMRCKKAGIFDSCKEKRHYTKPSAKRRQSAMKKQWNQKNNNKRR